MKRQKIRTEGEPGRSRWCISGSEWVHKGPEKTSRVLVHIPPQLKKILCSDGKPLLDHLPYTSLM